MLLLTWHLIQVEANADSMHTGLCGAYARANALGLAPCLALRAIVSLGSDRGLIFKQLTPCLSLL